MLVVDVGFVIICIIIIHDRPRLSVCCLVLLILYLGIVTVPGFPRVCVALSRFYRTHIGGSLCTVCVCCFVLLNQYWGIVYGPGVSPKAGQGVRTHEMDR